MKGIFNLLPYRLIPISLKVFLLSVALVTASFLLQGNIGINLADEGFLWYGTTHTALGEVPIRDFQSYDPGRYYWGAAWFRIFGDSSIKSLRISTAIFQSLGLTFGLLSLRRVTHSWWFLTIAGLLLLLWMYPNYYIFEPSIAMAAVYFAILLLERPSLLRHFIAGSEVGLSAFMGINHGLYTFLSFLLLLVFIWVKLERNELLIRLITWGSGIIVGYSILLFMLIVIPGFFESFVESIKFYFRLNTTNLTLPVPWPWHPSYLKINLIQAANVFSIGLFFLTLPLFNTIIIIHLLLSKRHNLRRKHLLAASTFVSITYIHHAFSRADIEHLAAAIHPLLIGLISLPSSFQVEFKKRLRICLLFATFTATLFSVGIVSPYYLKAAATPEQYVKRIITGEPVWIDIRDANVIDISKIIYQLVQHNEGLLIAPNWPGLYPILKTKSPLWDIYFLFPETEDRQKEMIEELHDKNVNWVILGDVSLDNRDDLRFKNTHSILWKHFLEDFEVVEINSLPNNYQLLHRKTTAFSPQQLLAGLHTLHSLPFLPITAT